MTERIKPSERLCQFVDKEVLEKLLRSFSRSTGLKALLVDEEGKTMITPSEGITDSYFCQMVHSDAKGIEKCRRSYARAGLEASKYGVPYIFRCHAGLIAWAAPILIDEVYAGSIICGQVLMWEPEDYFLEEIETMVTSLTVDLTQVKQAAAQLEVISGDRVQAAADLLFVVANQIMKTGMTVLDQRRRIAEQEALLGEVTQAKKKAETAARKVEARSMGLYSLDKEQQLAAKVRNAEYAQAASLLDELLADIIQKSFDDIEFFKTRVFELLVVISRAAVEGGAVLSDVLKLNAAYHRYLIDANNTSEICLCIKNELQTFIRWMEEAGNSKNLQLVQKAAEFIRQNFQKKINMVDVAEAVYLSPSYLSRIFSRELGCTLMEYLTRVRVEKAKTLLKNPKFNVMQVANQLGFDDPGYFTKVFKKSEGVTPSQFRQKAL